MSTEVLLDKIEPEKAIYAVNATLRRIDERIVDHGERVAYIAYQLCQMGHLELDEKKLFLLCAFYDIGAYKTEELDKMLEFETVNVQKHSIYGYLFLKYLTPLSDYAEAVLYHHSSWEEIQKSAIKYGEYAAMIHMADRLDVALTYAKNLESVPQLLEKSKRLFREDYYNLAQKLIQDKDFLSQLSDGTYHQENLRLCETFHVSVNEALDFLKMIVYSIDFRSDHTVTHTVNTVAISVNIARHFHMTEDEVSDIYIGAMLHDIGKIAIPLSILESPGRLNDDEMKIMRTHVDETEYLIDGIVPDNICQIALRHHEKLDGHGYPKGLPGDALTFSQRIVAVADIVSALSSRRSYKEPFPKEKTLAIIGQLSGEQLDEQICKYVLENYDTIMADTDDSRIQVIQKYQDIMEEYSEMMMTPIG